MALSSQGLHSLTTIIKRLEAATSRLEDIAITTASTSSMKQPSASIGEHLGPHVAPPAVAAAAGSPIAAAVAAPSSPASKEVAAEDPATVKAFDAWVDEFLKPFLNKSIEVGGVVAEQGELVKSLFTAQRAFILQSTACTKPSAAALPQLLTPMSTLLQKISDIKDANRRSLLFNSLSAVSEGIPAAGWVALDSKPGPYVAEMKDSAVFWTNRVMKENKDKGTPESEVAIAWTKAWVTALDELRKYIMAHYTTGLTWNAKGKDPSTYTASAVATPAPAVAPVSSAPAPTTGPPAGLFSELSKGSAVTSGLRKVDKSEMTHKNPELRTTSVVAAAPALTRTASGGKPPVRPTKPKELSGKKPAKFALEGNRWVIEYQENNNEIIVENTEINQIVNIYGCKSSVVQIKGKVNAVNLISCQKTSVLLDSVVSSLSITSSPSFTIQILGKTPTILVDSTDSGLVYLSKDCLDVEIITAKSSSINISIPDEKGEEGEMKECPVPEQLKTVVKNGKLVSSIVEHAG